MKATTRILLLAAGLAAFEIAVWMVVTVGAGWVIIGGIVTTALWGAALWGDLEIDAPDNLGEAPVLDHRGDVTVIGGGDAA